MQGFSKPVEMEGYLDRFWWKGEILQQAAVYLIVFTI